MNGFELVNALNDTMLQAKQAVNQIVPAARKKAEAEAAYRSALARVELRLKAEGHAATLVRDLAAGNDGVCQRYVDRIVAEAEYDACREEVMLRKKEVDVLREAIQREWGAAR